MIPARAHDDEVKCDTRALYAVLQRLSQLQHIAFSKRRHAGGSRVSRRQLSYGHQPAIAHFHARSAPAQRLQPVGNSKYSGVGKLRLENALE
jgi:hypothetical protein